MKKKKKKKTRSAVATKTHIKRTSEYTNIFPLFMSRHRIYYVTCIARLAVLKLIFYDEFIAVERASIKCNSSVWNVHDRIGSHSKIMCVFMECNGFLSKIGLSYFKRCELHLVMALMTIRQHGDHLRHMQVISICVQFVFGTYKPTGISNPYDTYKDYIFIWLLLFRFV